MTPLFLFTAFTIAILSGFLGALLGLGGGIIIVPLLIFILKIPIQIAAGASIVAVVATSSASASVYVRDEITNIRLGMFLELATTLGAISGAILAADFSENVLKVIFGLSLLYASFLMWHQLRKSDRSWEQKENDRIAEKLQLGDFYYDSARSETITYGVSRSIPTFLISYVAGILSGLLGIGGGGVKVPAMNIVSGVPMKAAVATSNFMIGVTASASALIYIRNGFCESFTTAPVVLGTLIGSYYGARYALMLRGVLLKKVFIVILLLIGIRMIISGGGFF
jgi:uncharacterized membrane protein YfcA